MKIRPILFVPFVFCAGAVGLALLFLGLSNTWPGFQLFRRLEWISYDWRVRTAAAKQSENATNLGLVFISDSSIKFLQDSNHLDYIAGLYWPRHVYGRLVKELASQQAEAVALDVLFTELRHDQDQPHVRDEAGQEQTPDNYFATQMLLADNVILGADKGLLPHATFRNSAWRIGDTAARRDADGILRRAKAFERYKIWHPLIEQAAQQWQADLTRAEINSHALGLPTAAGEWKWILLDKVGNFDQVKLFQELGGTNPIAGARVAQKPFTESRVWDLGFAMAAREMKLDLDHPQISPGKITLKGPGGLERVIPIDNDGQFYIDWTFTPFDPRLTRESIESLLLQEMKRRQGAQIETTNRWQGKLVLVGSTATFNDLTDLGATPLEHETFLTTRYLNTANSLLTGRFVQFLNWKFEALLIIILGIVAWPLTWNVRPPWSTLSIVLVLATYCWLANHFFSQQRLSIPLVLPLTGLLLSHFSLLSYKTFFEQNERRRVKNLFARIVSPNVVNELLGATNLSLVGARREVTMFFADVRGFTELTDLSQAQAEKVVREYQLPPEEAKAYFDSQAQELLQTINLYLGLIADIVKSHEGTLDKYIGDCVMAFWGAPVAQEKHAVLAVRAAIESQRAIHELNQRRADENKRLQAENHARLASGQKPLPLLKLLLLGTGINTGTVTIGLMGSDAHIVNYTVFGREVNLASRLENVSGRGRILIGENTFKHLHKFAPELAAKCEQQAPMLLKGFLQPIQSYSVNWKNSKLASGSEQAIPDAEVEV